MIYHSIKLLLLGILGIQPGIASVNYPAIPNDETTPVQQRIAVKGPDEISIGWNTYTKLDQVCVHYGLSKSNLNHKKCSSEDPVTYGTSRTYFNAVVLKDLKPATKYYYKIKSGNSSIESFLSPRTAGDTTPFNMNVVVDLGVYGENGFTTHNKRDLQGVPPELNHSTIAALARTPSDYEIVIHPGDFAYADDWVLTPSDLLHGKEAYEAIIENFYDQLAPVAGRKIYMTSPGNHEASCEEVDFTSGLCPEGQHNFTDFKVRFGQTMGTAFPSKSSNSKAQVSAKKAASLANPPFWYSFEYGMAHIVMYDTETDFKKAPDGPDGSAHLNGGPFGAAGQQKQFLEADLASVDRSITPWVIAAGHRPWYALGAEHCGACQDAFESILYQYGVDLLVFGHVHNTQRFAPMYKGKIDPAGLDNPKAAPSLILGGAGNLEGLSKIDNNATGNVFGYADDWGYGTVKILDKNHLEVDLIRSSTGEVIDNMKLFKKHDERFVNQ